MVYFKHIEDYNNDILKQEFEKVLKFFKFNLKHEDVLLKPNLISPKSSKKAVNTHPLVVEALASLLLDYGNKVFIGDSPGVGTLKLNLKISGYMNFINRMNIGIISFSEGIIIKKKENKILKRFRIAKSVIDFQNIINIAKLKTHSMTGMTLSVKNLYGCIPGKDKIEYHLKAGHNIENFADILIDICETVNPILNVIDGIIGMEGNGPTSGSVRDFGIFAASTNPYMLDRAIELLVGFKGKTIITLQAEKRGLLIEDNFFEKKLQIRLPVTKSASFNVPKFLINFFGISPIINNKLCKKCFKCMESCPTKAIFLKNNKLKINYSKCIKCFCCHELCIFDAVKLIRNIYRYLDLTQFFQILS